MKTKNFSLWMAENWRSVAFLIYAAICLFDFIIMPGIYQAFNHHLDPDAVVKLALMFKDTTTQIEVLKTFGSKITWVPLTMAEGAAFHYAFGVILGAASWTRGQEKIAKIQQGSKVDNPDA